MLQCLMTIVFDQYLLPVIIYDTETWPLTMGLIRNLEVAQKAMEKGSEFFCRIESEMMSFAAEPKSPTY